ncbi:MAG TPA: hypothetical protein VLM36_02290 [Sphingomicrobium sp.]|nr:hypothetical protein [Sphingomicrobium sp.]
MSARRILLAAIAAAAALPAPAFAQDAGSLPLPGEQKADAADQSKQPNQNVSPLDQLKMLQAERQDMQRRMEDFDARIDALESKLGVATAPRPATSPAAVASAPVPVPVPVPSPSLSPEEQAAAAAPAKNSFDAFLKKNTLAGTFKDDTGWVLVDSSNATEYLGLMTYARYLNQNALDSSYTDSFGRVIPIHLRNEVQLYKVSLQFKGWLFSPRFTHLIFIWTNNANQGEPAQVAIAGFLRYKFANWLTVSAGIMPLPTTRSTNYNFPKWLRHDNRLMADEFYRGSYTSGIDALGQITKGLEYRVMLGNNLSQLGVASKQLDNKFDTLVGALWWMPTTGEFGLANGYGDYDYHQKVATLIGIHAGRSTETAQGQPSVDQFENSQIRLTDGTLLFSPDPFGTGGKIEQALWQMASVDAGIKYKGFSLEGQWYWRRVNHFKTIGFVPVSEIRDNGMGVQVSAMPVKDYLQAYVTYSKIWGQNGNPDEYAAGVNYYPFGRREMHVNLEAIHLDRSPVGGYHLPVPVGGKGWVFLSDWVLMF